MSRHGNAHRRSDPGCGVPGESEGVGVSEDQLVYGTDDRLEYGQVLGTKHQAWADSTNVLVDASSLSCSGGTCSLTTVPFDSYGGTRLCNGVRFRGQPSLGFCTGFLVAPDKVVTAGHCFSSCAGTRFVFGYTANASGSGAPTSVPASDVYGCTGMTNAYPSADWALVQLDRVVTGPRYPLYVRHSGSVALNQPLALTGHPMGIPLKVSPTGAVTHAAANTFSHNVESFGGNSGSPVFASDVGVVEGIHVTPPTAHFFLSSDGNGSCMAETVCPTSGCPGFSGATRITLFSQQVPLTPVLTSLIAG